MMLALSSEFKLGCEKGSALLLVIILMVVFSLLTVSMFELLRASTQISGNYRRDLTALYIADAGIEDAISRLRANPDMGTVQDILVDPFGDGSYEMDIYAVSLPDPSPSIYAIYRIVSTGTIGGFKRAIEAHVKFVTTSGGASGYAAVTMLWQTVPPP
jgi:hypothetical protein